MKRRTVPAAAASGSPRSLAASPSLPQAESAIGDRAVRVTTTTNFITDTVARIGRDPGTLPVSTHDRRRRRDA